MEVNDVGVDGVESLAKRLGLEKGLASHLRGQWRDDADARLKRMDMQARRGGVGSERMVATDGIEGINAMEDVDLVPAADESPRQAIDVSGVSAEAMGPEERRHHADLHGRPPCRPRPMRRQSGPVLLAHARESCQFDPPVALEHCHQIDVGTSSRKIDRILGNPSRFG
jgi:hypothetical protein